MKNEKRFKVTPWEVTGNVDYDKLLIQFGAEYLNKSVINRFPQPPHLLVRRKLFYAHRDLDKYLDAYEKGEKISIVTGRGPSGKMHIGHLIPFYFAKWVQQKMNAYVYIPISDDEKYFVKKDKSTKDIYEYTINNLIEILAVGFDPKKTRIIVDMLDADIIYPFSAFLSKYINYSTVKAVYGISFTNIGWIFYPAVQSAHLLLPQVLLGKHMTLVPIAIDQDPHIRICRDIAVHSAVNLYKPATLLAKFLPTLEDPTGKMSTSNPNKVIWLDDTYPTIKKKLTKYAFSGGQPSTELHRKLGGNPDIDVCYLMLYYFFEKNDEKIKEIYDSYKKGEMLTGELKEYTAKRIHDFIQLHNERKEKIKSDFWKIFNKYKLKKEERKKVLQYVLKK